MKNILKTIVFALVTAVSLSACSEIPSLNGSDIESSDISDSENSSSSAVYNETDPDEFEINSKDFVTKLNAEGGVYEQGEMLTDGDFDGRGFVRFENGGKLTHIVNTPTAQHYRFILAVRSEKGASIKLSVKDKTEGMFYIPPSEDDNSVQNFGYAAVDSVYLSEGKNVFVLSVEKGRADIDYIMVESSEKVDSALYRTGSSAVNPYASLGVVGAMKYLSDIYGEYSLTAVNVSVGTNAEIDAVYDQTGRYPAVRCSELAYAVMGNVEKEELLENDIELAVEWAESGGLVSYKWHWYSPNRLRSVKSGAFDLSRAFENVDLEEIALMASEDLSMLNTNGHIPNELYELLADIDKLSESLLKLKNKDIITLFEPLPNADSGLYWWGDDPESYKKLYTLVFNRLCNYHRLSNLIFVYSGANAAYYPGTGYCDIVGQNFFEKSNSSFAGIFSAAAGSLPARKILAITACDIMPDIDLMYRDNAMWLWCAIESGEYLIDQNGAFSSEYNSPNDLNRMYNSTVMLTRDELPDMTRYSSQ